MRFSTYPENKGYELLERGYWIRSKPVYASLLWHEKATSHLLVAQGQGGNIEAISVDAPKQAITVLYTPHNDSDYSEALIKVVPEGLHILESEQAV